MHLTNTATHYGQVARLLHWTSVGLMLMSVLIGTELAAMGTDAERDAVIARHTSYGLLLLGVMLARFAWRLSNLNPVQSYTLPAWQRRSAISLHWFLYALVFTQCVIGIGQLLAGGIDIALFGHVLLMSGATRDTELYERLNDVHGAFANVIYMTIAVHVCAAIVHQIFGVREPSST